MLQQSRGRGLRFVPEPVGRRYWSAVRRDVRRDRVRFRVRRCRRWVFVIIVVLVRGAVVLQVRRFRGPARVPRQGFQRAPARRLQRRVRDAQLGQASGGRQSRAAAHDPPVVLPEGREPHPQPVRQQHARRVRLVVRPEQAVGRLQRQQQQQQPVRRRPSRGSGRRPDAREKTVCRTGAWRDRVHQRLRRDGHGRRGRGRRRLAMAPVGLERRARPAPRRQTHHGHSPKAVPTAPAGQSAARHDDGRLAH